MENNLYVSAILNFQESRGRPLEYYTEPLNDFAKYQQNIIVYVDSIDICNKLSSSINKQLIDYDQISNFSFEQDRKSMFLTYFNNDYIWYNLSRTYLLKPKLIKMTKDNNNSFDRYVWIDAGMPCSHIFNHSYDNYENIYTELNVFYIDSIFSKYRFLSQNWVVHQQNGVDMRIVYEAFQLMPDGQEHISACVFALERSIVDNFSNDFYDMLHRFNKINFSGVEENIFIAMLAENKSYCSKNYSYNEFINSLKSGIV